jgi:ligand-binding sensor domain-containing protein
LLLHLALKENQMRFPAPITRTLILAALQLSLAIAVAHAQFEGGVWRPAAGPYGGTITALVATATSAMIVGTPAGLYRSTDNGSNWVQQIGSMPIAPIYALARDSAGVLYAATMSGIFRSNDDGVKWIQIDVGAPAQDVRSLAIYDRTRLLAGGLNRTYRWDEAMKVRTTYFYPFSMNTTYLTALAVQDGIVYAGTSDAGFFYSDDGAKTMQPMEGLPCNAISSMEIRPLDSGGVGLAVGTSCGLYRWATNAPVWTEFSGPLSGRPIGAVKLIGLALFAGTKGSGIFRTLDGINWIEVYNGMENPTINAIEGNLNGMLFCGTQHGVQRTENLGERWESASTGILATNIRAVLVDDKGTIFASTETGIYRSVDMGASWQEKNYLLTDRDVQSIAMDDEGKIWVGTRHGRLYSSNDEGDSWTEGVFISSSPIESILWDNSGNGHVSMSGADGGVYSSLDRGGTWKRNLQGDSRAMAQNNTSSVYAVTSDQGLYYTGNSGSSWKNIRKVQEYTSAAAYVSKVAIGGRERVDLSINGGTTWKSVAATPCGSVKSLLFDNMGRIVAGTGCGVYRSTDNGVTWQEDRIGLNARQVTALGRQRYFSKFEVAGTDGAGIYLRENTAPTNSVDVSTYDASGLAIDAAQTGMMTLTVNHPGRYTVTLYDPLGRQLQIVADREFDIGSHRIVHTFDGLASGVYLLQVRGAGSVATTKMVIER